MNDRKINCPLDNAEMILIKEMDIEVDVCPECGSIFLDKGELDQLKQKTEQHLQKKRTNDVYSFLSNAREKLTEHKFETKADFSFLSKLRNK